MEKNIGDPAQDAGLGFHHPPTCIDPHELYAILERQAVIGGMVNVALLRRAFEFALGAHDGMRRDSGEPYINHPLHVALILSYLQVDVETLAAALLHDVVEDTPVTDLELAHEFGPEIAALVDGVTKFGQMAQFNQQQQDAANILRVLMSLSADARVIFIKLADRLHNLRTLEFKRKPSSRWRTAHESLEIYAPVADRLGIAMLRKEIEDIAFSYLDHDTYQRIKLSIEKPYQDQARVERIQSDVIDLLQERAISDAEIQINPRRVYDMYHRLLAESNPRLHAQRRVPPQLRFLVFVPDVSSCYAAMGAIHSRWPAIPGEVRDYISMPLHNGYQSLHTTVLIDRQPVKFQIRTWQMHHTAQRGLIAFMQEEGWQETHRSIQETMNALVAMAQEAVSQMENPDEWLSRLRSDELETFIYVYTPKNEMILLPAGSTPLDFAYKVHTEVGHKCCGALVDGHWMPLNYVLRTGENVQILTGEEENPNYDWLNPDLKYARISLTREKIRRWFRRRSAGEQIEWGYQQLWRVARRLALSVTDFSALARRRGLQTEQELMLEVGRCQIMVEHLLEEMVQLYSTVSMPISDEEQTIDTISGAGGLELCLSACCRPQPGDDIVGYILLPRHLVQVHRSTCPDFLAQVVRDRTRMISLHWGKTGQTYTLCASIRSDDRPFFLHDVLNIVYEEGVNVAGLELQVNRAQDALIHLCIDVTSWKQLNRVLGRIEDLSGIIEVRRDGCHSPMSPLAATPIHPDTHRVDLESDHTQVESDPVGFKSCKNIYLREYRR